MTARDRADDGWAGDDPQTVALLVTAGVFTVRARNRGVTAFVSTGTHKRLFRCANCGWRGWLDVLQYFDAASVGEANLDLRTLDKKVWPDKRSSRARRSLGDTRKD